MNNRKNNGFVRNPFLYLLIIVAAVTGFQYFFAGNGVGQSQQINYTELVKEIKNDKVKIQTKFKQKYCHGICRGFIRQYDKT